MRQTEHFRGKLLRGETLFMESIEGHLHSLPRPHSGMGEWTGYFEFPPEMRPSLTEGARYKLVLLDGRSGFIRIHVRDNDPLGRNLASFHGAGIMKKF